MMSEFDEIAKRAAAAGDFDPQALNYAKAYKVFLEAGIPQEHALALTLQMMQGIYQWMAVNASNQPQS